MRTGHPIWVVKAGASGDVHHPEGQLEGSSEQMAEELAQLVWALSDMLDRVQEAGRGYHLQTVTFDATFDGQVGFALVGREGAASTVRLTFERSEPRAAG